MSVATTSTVEKMLGGAVETYNKQDQMLPLVKFTQPDPAKMQNAGNAIWQDVEQHAPSIAGWDVSGQNTGIIQEAYPAIMGVPDNDLMTVRVDDMRDESYWVDRAEVSGRQRATELNKRIAAAIAQQGSLFLRSDATNGFDFVGGAQTLMNERQGVDNGRNFMLNDRDKLTFASDLSSRQNIVGRPEEAWSKGQIGSQVAEFDIFTGSFLPNLVGGADPATTVTGNQSFAPEGGTVNPTTLVVTNVDYRSASIPVAASASYNVGDKIQFANTAVPVESVGLSDKTSTGQPMTFTVISKPDATTIQVFPKPIAYDDPALSTLEKASANINTRILNAATVNRQNIDATNKTNLFWDKNAIEVLGGAIPAEKFAQFGGMKSMTDTLSNGLTMYMLYDGNIETATLTYRLFVWYGITVCNPSNCGVAVTF